MTAPRSTEAECDFLIATLYGPSAIVRLGRKDRRTPNTSGVPDRLYFIRGRFILFEVKSANDYLSAEQIVFLNNVLTRSGYAGCGNRDDLAELLNSSHPRKTGEAQIAKYSTRKKALRTP